MDNRSYVTLSANETVLFLNQDLRDFARFSLYYCPHSALYTQRVWLLDVERTHQAHFPHNALPTDIWAESSIISFHCLPIVISQVPP